MEPKHVNTMQKRAPGKEMDYKNKKIIPNR